MVEVALGNGANSHCVAMHCRLHRMPAPLAAGVHIGPRPNNRHTANKGLGWIPRRVVSAYDVVNASYLPTTIHIYDLEIRSINNYRKSYDIASFLVSTKISRRCRFGNSKPCKYIRSSYVRRNCIYDNNRVSANISSYDYR